MRRRHNPKGIIRYNPLPEFKGWPVNLGQAYDFYERNGMVHLNKDGVIECYQEFDKLGPDEYELGDDIKLVDLI